MTSAHRWLIALCVGAFLAVSAFAICRPNVVAHPLIDDSFYAFSIARNIADGHGITYGGNPTNGFQPLYVFIIAGVYKLVGGAGRDLLAIRVILGLHAVLIGAAAVLLGRIVRDRTKNAALAALAGCVWLIAPTTIWRGFNGLETALVTLMMLATLSRYFAWFDSDEKAAPTLGRAALLGILIGIGELARIDFFVFAAILGAAFWLLARTPRAAMLVLTSIVVAAAVASPWFIFNKMTFGHFMPISATATSAVGEVRGIAEPMQVRAGKALECFWWSAPFSGFGAATLYAGALRTAAGFAALGGCAALLLAIRRHPRRRDGIIFVCIFIAYAVVYTKQSVATWFFNRYMFPSTALLTTGFAYAADAFLRRTGQRPVLRDGDSGNLKSQISNLKSPVISRSSPVLVAALAAYLVLNTGFIAWRALKPGSDNIAATKMQTADYIRSHNIAGPIGAFQSGVLEYFLPDRIVNLDGKTNADALHAMMGGRLDEYMRSRNLKYLVDWPDYCETILRQYPRLRARESARSGPDVIFEFEPAR